MSENRLPQSSYFLHTIVESPAVFTKARGSAKNREKRGGCVGRLQISPDLPVRLIVRRLSRS